MIEAVLPAGGGAAGQNFIGSEGVFHAVENRGNVYGVEKPCCII